MAVPRRKGKRRSRNRTRSTRRSRRRRPARLRLRAVWAAALDALGVGTALLGFLTALALFSRTHSPVVAAWLTTLRNLFGLSMYAIPPVLMVAGLWVVSERFEGRPPRPGSRFLGSVLIILSSLGAAEGLLASAGRPGLYGGRVGFVLFTLTALAFGRWGALVVLVCGLVVGLLLVAHVSISESVRTLLAAVQAPEITARFRLPDEVRWFWWRVVRGFYLLRRRLRPSPSFSFQPLSANGSVVPTRWPLPPWEELLEDREEQNSDPERIREQVYIIEETLHHFGVPARVVEVVQGPRVTRFSVEPGYIVRQVRGKEQRIKVKVRAITALANDLALALAARRIRIEAPIPGQPAVGIEVPNEVPEVVSLKSVMASEAFARLRGPLRLALGRDVSGEPVAAELTTMPHLLIAGATGSGKSVCINAIVASLLCHNAPDQLKFLMIDPKRVELVGYNGIPHLVRPVITEPEEITGALQWLVKEMEWRYTVFSAVGVRHLAAYNDRALAENKPLLPYIVVVIDELADLMLFAPDEVEYHLCRLAQMARATGIHLVVATQRPSVDVITGLIKANFPARIAFAVASQVDSRVILDQPGAETLLGRGDMLYLASDASIPRRIQGCYVDEEELERLITFWRLAQPLDKRSPAPSSERSYPGL